MLDESSNGNSLVPALVINEVEVDVPVLEYKGHRVVTLAKVEEVHGRPSRTARVRLNDHRARFERGFDYFVCDTYEAQQLGIVTPNGVCLLTETGYLLLVKTYSDDLAWRAQRELVRSYFRVHELEVRQPVAPALPNFGNPIATAEAWIEQAKGRRDAERALAAESQAKAELAAKVEVLEPKAEVHDQIADARGDRSIREAAKILGTGERRLFTQLRDWKILQRNNLPYQHHLESGISVWL